MSNENQKNHLKAYGIVYFALEVDIKSKWLLNYDGGAFLIENNKLIENISINCNITSIVKFKHLFWRNFPLLKYNIKKNK